MLGEGISILDLTMLLKAINDKELILQVKILDGEWKDLNKIQLKAMIKAITSGQLTSSDDIRARLFSKITTRS